MGLLLRLHGSKCYYKRDLYYAWVQLLHLYLLHQYFSKAFDLVCHNILLTKLYKYGVHGDLLNWCRDYLTERQQRVVVKGEASD